MYTLEEVKDTLSDRNLKVVAKRIGIHPYTLYDIVNGKSKPSITTYEKLVTYLYGGHNDANRD